MKGVKIQEGPEGSPKLGYRMFKGYLTNRISNPHFKLWLKSLKNCHNPFGKGFQLPPPAPPHTHTHTHPHPPNPSTYSTTVLHPSLTCQRMNFNFIRFSNSKKGLLIYFQSELLHVWWVFLSILWWVANSVSFMHRLQLSAPSVNLKSQFRFETRRLCNKYICFITPYMYTYMYQLSVKWNRRRITSL